MIWVRYVLQRVDRLADGAGHLPDDRRHADRPALRAAAARPRQRRSLAEPAAAGTATARARLRWCTGLAIAVIGMMLFHACRALASRLLAWLESDTVWGYRPCGFPILRCRWGSGSLPAAAARRDRYGRSARLGGPGAVTGSNPGATLGARFLERRVAGRRALRRAVFGVGEAVSTTRRRAEGEARGALRWIRSVSAALVAHRHHLVLFSGVSVAAGLLIVSAGFLLAYESTASARSS